MIQGIIDWLNGLALLPDWLGWVWWLLVYVVASLAVLVGLLVMIAFLLLMDRKVWAAVQMRRGPNVVGPFGLLQSFADMFKFVFKEPLIGRCRQGRVPAGAVFTATFALAAWAVIPLSENSWASGSSPT